MRLLLWCAAGCAGLYALHRLALWAESRGWIYYMKKRAQGGSLGSAFLEVQSIVQPETRHVIEMRQDERAERDDEGGQP